MEKVEEALKAIEYPNVKTVQIIFNIFRQRPLDLFFSEAQKRRSPIAGRELCAAAWLPDPSLAGADGKVLPQFMWSALDCPGLFASGAAGRGALLGLYAARVDRCVHVSEACVVIGWALGLDGRKHYTGTAVFDGDGEICGRAIATWIEPRQI